MGRRKSFTVILDITYPMTVNVPIYSCCSNVTILKLEPDKYCVYRGGKISI